VIGRLVDALPELQAGSLVALVFLIAILIWMCFEVGILAATWHADLVAKREAARVRPSSLPRMR
jgi:hypothetical protein